MTSIDSELVSTTQITKRCSNKHGTINSANFREDFDGWTRLTLNRPEKLNSLNVEMFVLHREHVKALGTSTGIGCVVIQDAGRCFAAGRDLDGISEGEATPQKI